MNTFNTTLALALTTTLAAPAVARAAPDDLDGRYTLTCASARITVGMQDFEFEADDGSVRLTTPMSHQITFDGLPCAPDALDEGLADLYDDCLDASAGLVGIDGIRDGFCLALSDAIGQLLGEVSPWLSGSFDVSVDPGSFFGIHRMDGVLTDAEGDALRGSYLITRSGRFVTATLRGAPVVIPPLCAVGAGVMTQSFSGRIDRAAGHVINADYDGDVSVFCSLPGALGGDDIGRLGITIHADVSGIRQ